jgi:hypothetical protein
MMLPPGAFDLHPRFQRLADYLAGKAPAGKLPGRQHIDPTELGGLLPFLMLMDVIAQPSGPPRYRIRLMGTEVVAIQGIDGTGKFAEELLTGEEGAKVIADYGEILRTKAPQYRRGGVAAIGRDHVPYARIAFPLASDGEHVDMLIFIFARDPD